MKKKKKSFKVRYGESRSSAKYSLVLRTPGDKHVTIGACRKL